MGFILKRSNKFPEDTAKVLNLYVIYISLPALVLINVPLLVFTPNLIVTVITPWLMLAVSALLILMAAKFYHWDKETTGALLLIVPLGNTSFMGIPLVEAFFGSSAIGYAVMYDQFGSFFALAIYGSIILAIYSDQSSKVSISSVVKQIVSFPPFISFVLALALYSVTLPQTYFDVLTPIANTLIPVVMVAVGFQLNLVVEFSKIKAFIIGLSVKMIIAPMLLFFGFMFFGLQGEIYNVSVFEAAMPPMISAGALAIMANLSPRLTAAMVAYGILLAFVTLPIWYYVLKSVY